jgi:hypothetical protein
VATLDNVAAGWRYLENFQAYTLGRITNKGSWKTPDGEVDVLASGPNKVLGFAGGDDFAALVLNSLILKEGKSATLFFRLFAPTNDTSAVSVNVGLTEKALRFVGDFAGDLGPYVHFERLDGESNISIQARNGVGADYTIGDFTIEPGKNYDFWIDIRNDTIELGDTFSVYGKAEGDTSRTLVFDQFIGDRNPAGSPELGLPTPDLSSLFAAANGVQGTGSVLLDDFYRSADGYLSTVPVAVTPFLDQASITLSSGTYNSSANTFTFSFNAAPGSYTVLKSTTLGAGSWSNAGTASIAAGNSTATFTDPTATGKAAFYKVQSP